ncbi:pyruvate decarboxylase-like protein [Aulographum hederae CBS 113979]|uniref:Pyruvate decarboxylase n=1 Tax=Aulographum hederae CBS 113979 TaxID=1176131 RepID=A0A6G1H684_9PEZI|nr:pyruvate decarboxylase-like protein [Aulographum hederae CBS 113979]
MATESKVTVAHYLFTRLRQVGIKSLHGVAGEYDIEALEYLEGAGLKWVGCANELNAGYAADGYARVKGISALFTPSGASSLAALSPLAGPFAENIPVVHIVSCPSPSQLDGQAHHALKNDNSNLGLFADMHKRVTIAQTHLNDTATAAADIDRLLQTCYQRSRPIYLALPTSILAAEVIATPLATPLSILPQPNTPEIEATASAAILFQLYQATRPCILVDGGALRRKITPVVEKFVRESKLPTFVTAAGKSAIDESLANFAGVYTAENGGAMRDFIGGSDCVIWIGGLGDASNAPAGFPKGLSTLRTIAFHDSYAEVGYARYTVHMRGILNRLSSVIDLSRVKTTPFRPSYPRSGDSPGSDYSGLTAGDFAKLSLSKHSDITITHAWLWRKLSEWLQPGDILLTECGAAFKGVSETVLPNGCLAISQTLCKSCGYALPAAQGAALAAREQGRLGRTVVFVGERGLQATAQAVGTMLQHNLDVTVFVITDRIFGTNKGYVTDETEKSVARKPWGDMPKWHNGNVPAAMGGKTMLGRGQERRERAFRTYGVMTKEEVERLWGEKEFKEAGGMNFVEMYMPKDEAPRAAKLACR